VTVGEVGYIILPKHPDKIKDFLTMGAFPVPKGR